MVSCLRAMARDLDGIVQSIVVSQISPADAAEMLRDAAAVERRAAVLKTLVAQRATEGGTWAAGGHRSAESWLGSLTGAGYGAARATLNASEKLGELPGLDEAARNGELSEEQLKELGDAATPENEQQLLDTARGGNTDALRKKCKQEKAKSRSDDDERARAERAHRTRFFRGWLDNEGAFRFEGKTTALQGAWLTAQIAEMANKVFKEAWADGRRESSAAYKLDALMRLVASGALGGSGAGGAGGVGGVGGVGGSGGWGGGVGGSGGSGGGSSGRGSGSRGSGGRGSTANGVGQVVIRVDASRLAGDDGVCETDVGPVPVDDAIGAILGGAFIKILLRDGVDVTKVKHVGRHIPAEVKTAIFERDGYACAACGATQCLEVHHYRVDFAKGGATEYWNLLVGCSHCHDLATTKGFRFEGPPGSFKLVPPP